MKPRPPFMEKPDKLDLATEVIGSAVRVLKAAGFYDSEIQELFAQVVKKGVRAPLWLDPADDEKTAHQ